MEFRRVLFRSLVKGGEMLGDIWYSAWQLAPEDKYLKQKLLERKNAARP